MIGYACSVAAETARTNVPGLIADALREDATRRAAPIQPAGTPDAAAIEAAAEAERAASAS
jgi:hypothetical protein